MGPCPPPPPPRGCGGGGGGAPQTLQVPDSIRNSKAKLQSVWSQHRRGQPLTRVIPFPICENVLAIPCAQGILH